MSLNKQFKRKKQQEQEEKNQANELVRRQQRALTEAMNSVQDQLGNISYQLCHLLYMRETLTDKNNVGFLQELDSAIGILEHRKNHRVNELMKISKLTEKLEYQKVQVSTSENTPSSATTETPDDSANTLKTVDCVNETVEISGKEYLATIAENNILEPVE